MFRQRDIPHRFGLPHATTNKQGLGSPCSDHHESHESQWECTRQDLPVRRHQQQYPLATKHYPI